MSSNKADLSGKDFFSSWSGGKDSCLALYKAIGQGGSPRCLLTMFGGDGARSKSHGLPPTVIKAQAEAMAIPSMIAGPPGMSMKGFFLKILAF